MPMRRVNPPLRLFKHLTLKDGVRLGGPTAAGGISANAAASAGVVSLNPVVGAGTGLAVGSMMYVANQLGVPLEDAIKDFAQIRLNDKPVSTPKVATIHDDVAVLQNGTVVGAIQIDSTELDLLSDREQTDLVNAVNRTFKSLRYPVDLHHLQRRIDLSEFETASAEGRTTDHFVVVRVFPDTPGVDLRDSFRTVGAESTTTLETVTAATKEERIRLVRERCRELLTAWSRGRLSAARLTGNEFRRLIKRFDYGPVRTSHRTFVRYDRMWGKRHPLLVDGAKAGPHTGWIAEVLNHPGPGRVDVVERFEPTSNGIVDELKQSKGTVLSNLSLELSGKDELVDVSVLDYIDYLLEEKQDEPLLHYSVYVVPSGTTTAELSATVKEVKRRLTELDIEYRDAWLQVPNTVRSLCGFNPDTLQHRMLVTGSDAANGLGIGTQDRDLTGVLYGIDPWTDMPVMVNRFDWGTGYNELCFGKIGSGKSVRCRLNTWRTYQHYDDVRIIIFDLKRIDFGHLVNALGGETAVIGEDDPAPDADVVRYVPPPGFLDPDDVAEVIEEAFTTATEEPERKTLFLIDEAHELVDPDRGTKQSLKAVETVVRTGREFLVATTLVTQQASDFLSTRQGKSIIDNSTSYVFMRHSDVESEVPEHFNLSRSQAEKIPNLFTGHGKHSHSEAILKITDDRDETESLLQIHATEREAFLLNAIAPRGGGDLE